MLLYIKKVLKCRNVNAHSLSASLERSCSLHPVRQFSLIKYPPPLWDVKYSMSNNIKPYIKTYWKITVFLSLTEAVVSPSQVSQFPFYPYLHLLCFPVKRKHEIQDLKEKSHLSYAQILHSKAWFHSQTMSWDWSTLFSTTPLSTCSSIVSFCIWRSLNFDFSSLYLFLQGENMYFSWNFEQIT